MCHIKPDKKELKKSNLLTTSTPGDSGSIKTLSCISQALESTEDFKYHKFSQAVVR